VRYVDCCWIRVLCASPIWMERAHICLPRHQALWEMEAMVPRAPHQRQRLESGAFGVRGMAADILRKMLRWRGAFNVETQLEAPAEIALL